MNAKTLPIDIKTTLLVCLFDFPEVDSTAAVGPSAFLGGTRPGPDGTTKNGAPGGVPGGAPEGAPGGAPGGAVTGERGGGAGVTVVLSLNGFPACLHNKQYHSLRLYFFQIKIPDVTKINK